MDKDLEEQLKPLQELVDGLVKEVGDLTEVTQHIGGSALGISRAVFDLGRWLREEPERHPVLDAYSYPDGKTLRQKLEEKTKAHGYAWSQVLDMLNEIDKAESVPSHAMGEPSPPRSSVGNIGLSGNVKTTMSNLGLVPEEAVIPSNPYRDGEGRSLEEPDRDPRFMAKADQFPAAVTMRMNVLTYEGKLFVRLDHLFEYIEQCADLWQWRASMAPADYSEKLSYGEGLFRNLTRLLRKLG